MNIDRVQGLVALYFKAGKDKNAVGVMAEYLMHQGLLTDAERAQVEAALEVSPERPLGLREIMAERDALQAAKTTLEAEVAALRQKIPGKEV